MTDLNTARTEAANLAGDLPGVLLEARRLAAATPGVHGRRRSGPGEAFWQFRDHRPEDGARLVDWRRSARGQRLYVREREKEAAQTAVFWLDRSPGMAWASGPNLPTKHHRGLAICLAFSILLARGGERVGALGGPPPRTGQRASDRLAVDLVGMRDAEPGRPINKSGIVVYASDFYAPVAIWRDRLKAAAAVGASGALIQIADPSEEDFLFRGRTQFEQPGAQHIVFGRAEDARDAYTERLTKHRQDMRTMALEFGFMMIVHRTDKSAAPALSLLASSLAERG